MAETITSGGICKRFSISRQALRDWRADPTFPRPLSWSRNGGGVWDLEAVTTWRRRKTMNRGQRKHNAINAYARRAGEVGHLSAVADAYGVDVGTLRRWVRAAGHETPRG